MNRNKVYIFIGVAGSGKSTLIKQFAQQKGLVSYDILDVMQPYLARYGSVTDKNQEILDEVVLSFVRSFPNRAFDILEFANGRYLPQILAGLKEKEIIVIQCYCPLNICKERNKLRIRQVPDHYLNLHAQFDTEFYQRLKDKFGFQLVIVDTTQSPQECLNSLMSQC